MKFITLDDIKKMTGKECTAIGNCGMSKDKLVSGFLLDGMVEGEPIIKNDKGRLISVNKNTLKLVIK